MKNRLSLILVFLFVIVWTSGAQAALYNLDIQSGSLNIQIAPGYSSLTLTTVDPLVVGYILDPAPSGSIAAYKGSADMDVTISIPTIGSLLYSFNETFDLGNFQNIDPNAWLVPGNHKGTEWVSGNYGGYTLTNASLLYNYTLALNGTDEFTLTLTDLTLSGGGTEVLLSGLVADFNATGTLPLALDFSLGTTLGVTPTGSLQIEASAVPVPSAVWLLGSGLMGLVSMGRKRRI